MTWRGQAQEPNQWKATLRGGFLFVYGLGCAIPAPKANRIITQENDR